MKIRFYIAILLLCFACTAQAQNTGNTTGTTVQGQGNNPPEPPAEAYTDCKGKTEGDVVQHTTPRGDKVSATCTSSPKGLFARPEHPPR